MEIKNDRMKLEDAKYGIVLITLSTIMKKKKKKKLNEKERPGLKGKKE